MNKILHNLWVERGDGFKPLTKPNGDFIYKESERHLASKHELSALQIQQQKDEQYKVDKEGFNAMLKMGFGLVYLLIILLCFFISAKVGVFMLAIGSFYLSVKLGFIVLLISLLLLI
jgi:hypothetical protein